MNLSFQWLSEYVKHSLSPSELARVLTFQACPVEGLEPVGAGDTRIGLEVTFNRPDLLSHVGVAREIACATGGSVKLPAPEPTEDAGCPVERCASVAVEAGDLCPRYTARVIRGVTVRESPDWLRRRLEAIGVRPVNNVVDVTNFVLFELGQPLHAFDLATLALRQAQGERGALPMILVRRARPGETFTAIDRSEHELSDETLVIADGRRPVALAGIMGGLDTEISDRTRDVLLESAYFDPVATRRACARTKLRSDSSYRFERGVDPALVELASRRAAALILDVAGGTLCAGVIDVDAKTLPGPRTITLRLHRLHALTGASIPRPRAVELLRGLGCTVDDANDKLLTVTVPTGRSEVAREIDLIEEVLRTHGYDQVPSSAAIPIRVAPTPPRERAIGRLKQALVGAGYREVLTISFVERDDAIDPPIFTQEPPHTVENPVAPETPALRRSLMGSLLRARRNNLDRGNRGARLFEVSTAYLRQPGRQPREVAQLGLCGDDGFRALKGAVEAALETLGLARAVRFGPAEAPFFTDEQAEIALDGAKVGVIGRLDDARKLSPRAKQLYESLRPRDPATLAILDLDALLAAAEARGAFQRRFQGLPEMPAVGRDLAVVVDVHRTWQEIADAVAAQNVEHLEGFAYILGSEFLGSEGKAVPAGKKSIALTLSFRARDRTLTGAEADQGREAVKAALREKLGAAFRE